MNTVKIITPNKTLKVKARSGESILSIAENNNIEEIYSACGGIASCGGCIVDIVEGDAGKISDKERKLLDALNEGPRCRLGCQTRINSDLTIKTITD